MSIFEWMIRITIFVIDIAPDMVHVQKFVWQVANLFGYDIITRLG